MSILFNCSATCWLVQQTHLAVGLALSFVDDVLLLGALEGKDVTISRSIFIKIPDAPTNEGR